MIDYYTMQLQSTFPYYFRLQPTVLYSSVAGTSACRIVALRLLSPILLLLIMITMIKFGRIVIILRTIVSSSSSSTVFDIPCNILLLLPKDIKGVTLIQPQLKQLIK